MITVQILEPEDAVSPEDWCRPLVLQTMSGGMSDSMSFKSCYGGTPENNVEWVKVKHVLGGVWYGFSVRKINASLPPMEFLHGDPPVGHRLDMKGYTDITKFGSP